MRKLTYTVYALVDPRNDTVRYVGRTKRPKARLQQHIEVIDDNPEKVRWINELRKLGLTPKMNILETLTCTLAEIDERERYWIQHFLSLGTSLTNIRGIHRQSKSVPKPLTNKKRIVPSRAIFMAEQWVTMKAAARRLGIPSAKISRWANKGLIQVKPNPFDKRSRLVELNELQEKIAELSSIQDSGDDSEEDEDDGEGT